MLVLLTLPLLAAWTAAAGAASSSPPSCRLLAMSRQAWRGGGLQADQVDCACSTANQNYIGNMNFVKVHLAAIKAYNRTVDISVRDCESLDIDVNLAEITNKNVNLRIRRTNSVKINNISLGSAGHEVTQSLVVENVTNLYVSGNVLCFRCTSTKGSLHFQLQNVSHVVLDGLDCGVPVKLSGRHILSLDISSSHFSSLPWPGIFLYNASRVSITDSSFPGLVPKTISLTRGVQVNVSNNLMDVANALKLLQYKHVNIKCNRKSLNESLPFDCGAEELGSQLVEPLEPALSSTATASLQPDLDNRQNNGTIVLPATLIIADAYGLVILAVVVMCVAVFLVCYCCCCCCPGKRMKEKPPPPGQHQLEAQPAAGAGHRGQPRVVTFDPLLAPHEADRYSNSSRAHLAPAQPPDTATPYYVTVEGVRSEEVEGGIVCGSLTLGPAFNLAAEEQEDRRSRAQASNTLKNQTFSKM